MRRSGRLIPSLKLWPYRIRASSVTWSFWKSRWTCCGDRTQVPSSSLPVHETVRARESATVFGRNLQGAWRPRSGTAYQQGRTWGLRHRNWNAGAWCWRTPLVRRCDSRLHLGPAIRSSPV